MRAGLLSQVYHGQNSTVAVKHLGHSYAALTEDTTRVMGRLKALYRSQAIACAGQKPYAARHRGEWIAKLTDSGLQRRARRLYLQLNLLQELRRDARYDLILECRKHNETKLLRSIPWLGPIDLPIHCKIIEFTATQFGDNCNSIPTIANRRAAEMRLQRVQSHLW